MRLDVRAFALASGAVMAVAFALCAGAIAYSPQGFMAVAGYLTHIDLTPLARTISWGSFFAGLLAWTAFATAWAGATAWLYNRVQPSRPPAGRPEEAVTVTRERERAR